jgi:hypothetical protein
MSRWLRQEDGVWVFADEGNDKVWAEVTKADGGFKWEITDGKNTFARGEASQMKDAQDAAQTSFKHLIDPPKKIPYSKSWHDKYEVTLPGGISGTTEAANAQAALGHVLSRNPGFSYQGVTIGPKGEFLGLVFKLLMESGEAKIRKVN